MENPRRQSWPDDHYKINELFFSWDPGSTDVNGCTGCFNRNILLSFEIDVDTYTSERGFIVIQSAYLASKELLYKFVSWIFDAGGNDGW